METNKHQKNSVLYVPKIPSQKNESGATAVIAFFFTASASLPLIIVIMLLVNPGENLNMVFTQPYKILSKIQADDNGISVSNAKIRHAVLSGDSSEKYVCGVAQIDIERDLFFCFSIKPKHKRISAFRASDSKNAVTVDILHGDSIIRQLVNNHHKFIYLVSTFADNSKFMNHAAVGRGTDGEYIKFFDTHALRKKYFEHNEQIYFGDVSCKSDKITLEYFDANNNSKGKFVLTWNNESDSFDIAKVL